MDNKVVPDLPFGIKFRGATLVSLVYKRDPKQDFYWKEYLFCQQGTDYYVTLADIDGFWMVAYHQPPDEAAKNEKTYKNIFHHPLLTYQFEVVFADGEFNWDITGDEKLTTKEFPVENDILINEDSGTQSEWYTASFLTPVELADQLELPMELLSRRKYFNPKTFYPRWKGLFPLTGIVLALFLLTALCFHGLKTPKRVFAGSYHCVRDTSSWAGSTGAVAVTPVITDRFHVDGGGALDIAAATQLDNNWLELELSLINEKTGEEFEADKTLEYYHGYEGGESWSEGSNTETIRFSSVPEGDYHLNIYPTISPELAAINGNGVGQAYDITVTQLAPLKANFYTTLTLLLIYPVVQFFRKKNYESIGRHVDIYGEK